jgi:hypothetical protein
VKDLKRSPTKVSPSIETGTIETGEKQTRKFHQTVDHCVHILATMRKFAFESGPE